jgi:hypothetical protein
VERAGVIKRLRNDEGTRGSSLQWVGIAVGCILDPVFLNGNLGFDLIWQSATINGTGDENFAVTSLKIVGVVVESVLRHWEEFKNQYIYAAGILTSANEIVTAFEKLTQSKWGVVHSDVEDCVREAQSRIERGFLSSGMFLLERSVLYDGSLHATKPFRCRRTNEILGLEPELVDEIAGQVFHDLRHRGRPSCGCG